MWEDFERYVLAFSFEHMPKNLQKNKAKTIP